MTIMQLTENKLGYLLFAIVILLLAKNITQVPASLVFKAVDSLENPKE